MEIFCKRTCFSSKFWFSDYVRERKAEAFVVGRVNREVHLETTPAVSEPSITFWTKKCLLVAILPLRGESALLRYCRGFLALLFLSALIGVSIFSIILGPIRESLLIPVKDIRAMDVPVDFRAETSVWNVIVVSSNPVGHYQYPSTNDSRPVSFMTWTGRMTRNFMTL